MIERLAKLAGFERRSSIDATDLVVEKMLADAGGTGVVPEALAAVRTAASLWARSLGAAVVQPASVARVLDASMLGTIGVELLLKGEFVARIHPGRGGLALTPASGHTVSGGPDEAGWRYRLDTAGPSRTESVTVPGADVLHIRLNPRAATHFRGTSPLAGLVEVQILGKLLGRVREQAAAEVGQIIGINSRPTAEQTADIRKVLNAAQGRVHFVGIGDKAPVRIPIGFDPSTEALTWNSSLTVSIFAAAGFPPGLFSSGSASLASRESWRRWSLTVAHLGDLVAVEAGRKLETQCTLTFPSLAVSQDVGNMARAFKILSEGEGGMPRAEALATVGL